MAPNDEVLHRLDAALERYSNVPALTAMLREAVGADPTGPLSRERLNLIEFLLQPSDEVFSAFLLGRRQFVVAQMDRDNVRLLVAVPVTRLRRVALHVSATEATLTIEIDADQSRVLLDTQSQVSAQGPLSQSQGRMVGSLQPAAYVATASLDESADLVRFAEALRFIALG